MYNHFSDYRIIEFYALDSSCNNNEINEINFIQTQHLDANTSKTCVDYYDEHEHIHMSYIPDTLYVVVMLGKLK